MGKKSGTKHNYSLFFWFYGTWVKLCTDDFIIFEFMKEFLPTSDKFSCANQFKTGRNKDKIIISERTNLPEIIFCKKSGQVFITIDEHFSEKTLCFEVHCIDLIGEILQEVANRLFLKDHLFVHGACVKKDNRVLFITGNSGTGKTTIALALWKKGWEILSDDKGRIDINNLLYYPSFYLCHVHQETLQFLGLNKKGFLYIPSKSELKNNKCWYVKNSVVYKDSGFKFSTVVFLKDSSTIQVNQLSKLSGTIHLIHSVINPSILSKHSETFFELLVSMNVIEIRKPHFINLDYLINLLEKQIR